MRKIEKSSLIGVPNGSRTRVAAVKGRCPWPLDDGDIKLNMAVLTSLDRQMQIILAE